MKYLFLAYLLSIAACSASQPTAQPDARTAGTFVTFKMVNNSVLPRKSTVIGYNPGEMSNWTRGMMLLPGAAHTFTCVVGTKIYLASDKQVEVVMSGNNILRDEPFLTVKAEDEGKRFPLNR